MTPTPETVKVERSIDITSSNLRRQILNFCYSACRIDGECLGWLPKPAYDQAHIQGRIVVCFNNDDLVGFVLWSCNTAELRCLQVWVRRDARLLLHGRALITWLDAEGRSRTAYRLRLWCAIDLAANHFWKALGFRYLGWRWGRAKNSRRHALWVRPINETPFPTRTPPIDPPPIALAPPTLPTTHQAAEPAAHRGKRQLPNSVKATTLWLPDPHLDPAVPRTATLSHATAQQ